MTTLTKGCCRSFRMHTSRNPDSAIPWLRNVLSGEFELPIRDSPVFRNTGSLISCLATVSRIASAIQDEGSVRKSAQLGPGSHALETVVVSDRWRKNRWHPFLVRHRRFHQQDRIEKTAYRHDTESEGGREGCGPAMPEVFGPL